MLRRRIVIGSLVTVAVLGLAGAVTAFAVGAHRGHHGMMRRVALSMIDEALDQAQATPEQRMRIHAARDRVFTAFEGHMQTGPARLEEALRLFEADTVDPAAVQALRTRRETEHRQIGDTVSDAILEAHATFTPAQRKVVADWIRDHRWH